MCTLSRARAPRDTHTRFAPTCPHALLLWIRCIHHLLLRRHPSCLASAARTRHCATPRQLVHLRKWHEAPPSVLLLLQMLW